MNDTLTIITLTAIGFYEGVLLTGAVRLFREGFANRIQMVFGMMMLYGFVSSTPYLIGFITQTLSVSLLAVLNTLNTAILCFLPLTANALMQEKQTLRLWLICFAPMLPEMVSWFILSKEDYALYVIIDLVTYIYLLCAYIYMLFRLRKWDRNLLDVFSDVTHKETLWYRRVGGGMIASFLLWIPLYIFPAETWMWLVYCLLNSILYFIITEYALKQEVFETALVMEQHEESEQESPLWVETLNNIIEVQCAYTNPDLNLLELSRQVGVNRTYLSRYINQTLHTTFYEYINDYRLKEACKLLATTQDSVESIAQKSGFGSRQTLLRNFIKKYGVSPSDWRNT